MVLVASSAMRDAQRMVIVDGLQVPDTGGVEHLNLRDILPAQPGNESARSDRDVVRKKHRRDQGDQKANSFESHINHRTAPGA